MYEFISTHPGFVTTALVFCPTVAILIAGLLEAWGYEMWMDE